MLGITWWHWLLLIAVCTVLGLVPRPPIFRRDKPDH